MRVRHKIIETDFLKFNEHAIDEVITGDGDSVPVSDLDVKLSDKKWHDLQEALDSELLIKDPVTRQLVESKKKIVHISPHAGFIPRDMDEFENGERVTK
jgi:hypothetical protein